MLHRRQIDILVLGFMKQLVIICKWHSSIYSLYMYLFIVFILSRENLGGCKCISLDSHKTQLKVTYPFSGFV